MQMRLFSPAVALVAFGIGARAFISSPSGSRLGCKHAKNILILRSTVEEEKDVAATAGEETPVGLHDESADATQSSLENDTIGLDKAEISGGSQKPGMAERIGKILARISEGWILVRPGKSSGIGQCRDKIRSNGTRGAEPLVGKLSVFQLYCCMQRVAATSTLVVYFYMEFSAWLLRTRNPI